MLVTSIVLVSVVFPAILAAFAIIASVVLAAMISRKAESAFVPEATPAETAEWVESFDSLDVDAEWIALAEHAADVDALIVALESGEASHRGAAYDLARTSIEAARVRIVGKAQRMQATTVDAEALANGRKLTSYSARIREACDRIRARNDEAAYLARLAIERTLTIARAREWCDVAGWECTAEERKEYALTALSRLGHASGDAIEADRAWASLAEACDAVRDAFDVDAETLAA